MATKTTFDPTANPFELLANAEAQSDAPERRKKPAKKDEKEEVGVVPTPAAKAQARQAKEAAAAKVVKPAAVEEDTQAKSTQAKKLTREQFLEGKKKGTLPVVPAGPDADGFSPSRPPRARGEIKENRERKPEGERSNNGERGRGGRGRGRGGRGRSDGEHHYQPPAHGREYDKKSGMNTGRKPFPKKGGSGAGNWGAETDEFSAITTSAQATEVVAQTATQGDDPVASKEEAEKTTEGAAPADAAGAAASAPAPPVDEDDGKLTMDEFFKKKAEQDKALASKISALEPRKMETTDLSQFKEHPKFAGLNQVEKAKAEKEEKEAALARRGEKVLSLDEVFNIKPVPIPGGRGRGRGGFRGGDRDDNYDGERRGRGGRGFRGGDRAEGGAVEGGEQRRGGRSGPRADRPERTEGGASPAPAEGEQRDGQRGGRGGRGGARGGRGGARGGRGGRGGKVVLDSNNVHHYPELGSDA